LPNVSVDQLCLEPATEIRRVLWGREVSARELLEAHLRVIERTNGVVNAIVTLTAERALERADEVDRELHRGLPHGPLHGLPIAHKDLAQTAGIRTTFGSPLFADHVPDADALVIERLRRAGAITVGKTNVPEWGAGSTCVNPVFGPTRNPYNVSLTPGGSSGGAAAALACGMVALADGSDMGGSLRNPASFCNVVGFRPSPGRVPNWPAEMAWDTLAVHGPMGRTVSDVALMLSAIAGPDDRSPISLSDPGETFGIPLDPAVNGTRIAWSRRLGELPVEPAVTAVLDGHQHVFRDLGCTVIETEPDFTGAQQAFETLRAWMFAARFGPLLDEHRSQLGDNVVWNTEQGLALTGSDLAQAEFARTRLFERIRVFMSDYDFLVAPVVQTTPFPVSCDHPTSVAGVPMHTYIDWMKSCYYISVVGLPCISVPSGFTPDGLPVGMQIIGRQHDDLGVLRLAHAFEHETEYWRHHPAV
jgi:amidase